MLVFGLLLLPLIVAASTGPSQRTYIPKIEGENGFERTLKSIEVIGEPADTLDLSGLRIECIDGKVFENFTHVKSVDLSNNSMWNPPSFWHLKNLQHLSLADNKIVSVDGYFRGLSNLKFLNISNNRIRRLSWGSLYGIGKSTNISAKINGGLEFLHTLAFDHYEKPEVVRTRGHFILGYPFYLAPRQYATACAHDGIIEEIGFYRIEYPIQRSQSRIPKLGILESRPTFSNIRHEPRCPCRGGLRCEEIIIIPSSDTEEKRTDLMLRSYEISGFANGWYRLFHESFITDLRLYNNNIRNVTTGLFNDLPANIINVDLSNNKIVSLKKGIIVNENIRFLNLEKNFISEIDEGALEKTKLWSLNLRKNQLNNTKFVETLPSTMQTLSLEENCIDELLPGVFSRFHELDKIDFSGNNITVIKNDSLHGLESAKSLILARNKIEKIESGAFRNMKSLRFLDLANNNLNNLEKLVFDGLLVLDHMDLSSNNIKEIKQDFFHNLPKTLHTLSLSFNQIEILENGTFFQSPIQKLYLDNNKLRKIENGTFVSSALKSLYLGKNMLDRINDDEFVGLDNLEFLDLSSNMITKINKGFAKHLGNVTELNLDDNPIKSLENGALFGLKKSKDSIVRLRNIQLELLQGGVFDDL